MTQYTIYGRKRCGYCDKAKALLEAHGLPFKYIDIEEDATALEWFINQGFETVPQVFQNNLLVGGYDALEAKFLEHPQPHLEPPLVAHAHDRPA